MPPTQVHVLACSLLSCVHMHEATLPLSTNKIVVVVVVVIAIGLEVVVVVETNCSVPLPPCHPATLNVTSSASNFQVHILLGFFHGSLMMKLSDCAHSSTRNKQAHVLGSAALAEGH